MMKFLSKEMIGHYNGYIGFLFLFLLLSLASCRKTAQQFAEETDHLATSFGFEKHYIKSEPFILHSYQKITDPSGNYVFYLEGDGLAFTRTGISKNPTPNNNNFLRLALGDNHPNVIYIARPCQYVPMELNEACKDNKYWTTDRFSAESVKVMFNAIKTIAHDHKFDIVGFSGGGAIATIIAAEHNNAVESLVTVAGNLDHVAFNNYHNARQMHESLNPINFVKRLGDTRQLHLSGTKDFVVPTFIAEDFVKKLDSKKAEIVIVKGASHNSGWSGIWSKVLKWMGSKNEKYQR